MESMETHKLISTDFKLENNSGTRDQTFQLNYMDIGSLDIKEEIIEEYPSKIATGQEVNKEYTLKIQESTKETKRKYKCDECEKTYLIRRTLHQHQRFAHGQISSPHLYECDFGDYVSNSKSALFRHISCKHLKQTTFVCGECGNTYGRKDTLNYHKKYSCKQKPRGIRDQIIKINPKVLDAKYVCEECGNSYTRKSTLQRHKKLACNNQEPGFVCHICDYKSMFNANLLRHIMTRHTS
ncbi:zinc finger protein 28-like [Belonocnema kinseyi]|uniref:zinc finger protein 28-like n=1 Tax=Belonocnema kinseyi TaxID=2817044 RepID=UPI00143D38FA|nr:zinc finger protein 28-like [Belonocnema kinseyi]